ncbi:MAG TPA: hypothetical protein VF973_05390 [Myxococcales bacterium]
MGVFGTRLFGQADRVPGLFCVRTRFFHVNFVPLVPLASYLVFEEKGGSGNRGVELKKLRWNSVLLAWLRTPLWIGCAVGTILGLVQGAGIQHDWQTAAPVLGAALAAGAAWYATYRFSTASFERAAELARMVGLPPEFTASLEQRFGRSFVPDPAQ